MKTQIIILSFAFFLFIASTSAISSYCGDDYCSDTFGEADPLSEFYCPGDCGIRTNSSWCEETYGLETPRDCPTCPTCSGSTCDISRISNSNLVNWCNTNGYNSGGGSCITPTPENNEKIFWLIFLVIGFIVGKYWRKFK